MIVNNTLIQVHFFLELSDFFFCICFLKAFDFKKITIFRKIGILYQRLNKKHGLKK